MARQPLVDERVVGGQQVEDVAVLPNDALEEQLGLALQALSQFVVPVGVEDAVGRRGRQVAEVEQLLREARDERIGARIGEHPPHLLLEHFGLAQSALGRDADQLVVGDAAPKEK